jgi:hypothetical protein
MSNNNNGKSHISKQNRPNSNFQRKSKNKKEGKVKKQEPPVQERINALHSTLRDRLNGIHEIRKKNFDTLLVSYRESHKLLVIKEISLQNSLEPVESWGDSCEDQELILLRATLNEKEKAIFEALEFLDNINFLDKGKLKNKIYKQEGELKELQRKFDKVSADLEKSKTEIAELSKELDKTKTELNFATNLVKNSSNFPMSPISPISPISTDIINSSASDPKGKEIEEFTKLIGNVQEYQYESNFLGIFGLIAPHHPKFLSELVTYSNSEPEILSDIVEGIKSFDNSSSTRFFAIFQPKGCGPYIISLHQQGILQKVFQKLLKEFSRAKILREAFGAFIAFTYKYDKDSGKLIVCTEKEAGRIMENRAAAKIKRDEKKKRFN